MAKELEFSYDVSTRRACETLRLARSSFYYQSKVCDPADLKIRMRDLAASRVRYGYRRIHVLLQREGWQINHKRVYRLYREMGLSIRTKRPKRRRSCKVRSDRPAAAKMNHYWSMDFMADQLSDGRWFRILTILDNYSRECLGLVVGQHLRAEEVVRALEHIGRRRGLPKAIQVDNGCEFTSKLMDQWAYLNRVMLDFSRPGKPTDNAFIESFNGRFREECLNQNWFSSLEEVEQRVAMWRQDYNEQRPHSALGNRTPRAIAEQVEARSDKRAA